MDIHSPTLFIEINNSEYIFSVQDENSYENLNLIYKCIVPIESKEKKKKINFDLAFDVIKNNVYIIEQKLNFTFKEVILIINNFESSFIKLVADTSDFIEPASSQKSVALSLSIKEHLLLFK